MYFPRVVEIIEVGPRDGLQNEKTFVPTEQKIELIKQLHEAGFGRIETASFVHPKVVPQMADAQRVTAFCNELGITYIALTPNMKALERAIEANVPQVAVFVGASETFNQKNINRSITESLAECETLFKRAKEQLVLLPSILSLCHFAQQISRFDALFVYSH